MCFSAAGSFAVAGVLTAIGGASVARNVSVPSRMFAAVPLIFAAQQAAEGVVWITMAGPPDDPWHRVAVATFLGVALVLWPTWLPLSLQRMERDAERRRWLTMLAWFGGGVSAVGLWLLARWQPTASITGHSITYSYAWNSNAPRDLVLLQAYLVPTITPLFVSTARLSRVIGGALVCSLIVAIAVQRDALTSVWCFFAAVLSVLVLIAGEPRSAASHADG